MSIRPCVPEEPAPRRAIRPGRVLSAALVCLVALAGPARGDERRLSLPDAVAAALSNNGELQVARMDAGIAADQVDVARSVYDPVLSGRVFGTRTADGPSASSVEASERQLGGEAALAGRVGTGLQYSLSATAAAVRSDDPFGTVYDPAYASGLELSLTQPLLRGAGGAANRQVILVATLRRQESEARLRAQLERTVSAVEVAYWNLVRAHKEREARKASLDLAVEQLAESRRLVRLGALSELDSTEAQAGVSRRRQELESAGEDVVEAEGILLEVLQLRASAAGWRPGDALVPTDSPDLVAVSVALDEHLALARRHRADLAAAARLVAAEAAALDVAGNRKKPVVDLVGRAGLRGFAGTLADTYATDGLNQADGGLDPPFFTDGDAEGGLGRSLSNLFSGRRYELYLGLRFELPILNREAEARYSIQERELRKARLSRRSLVARIENDVRTSLNRLKANAAIVTAADEAVVLSGRLLEGARRRFRNDASTSFDVLRIVDELTRSKIEAARARARYRIALSRLLLANGTLLQGRRIAIRSGAAGAGARSASAITSPH